MYSSAAYTSNLYFASKNTTVNFFVPDKYNLIFINNRNNLILRYVSLNKISYFPIIFRCVFAELYLR